MRKMSSDIKRKKHKENIFWIYDNKYTQNLIGPEYDTAIDSNIFISILVLFAMFSLYPMTSEDQQCRSTVNTVVYLIYLFVYCQNRVISQADSLADACQSHVHTGVWE